MSILADSVSIKWMNNTVPKSHGPLMYSWLCYNSNWIVAICYINIYIQRVPYGDNYASILSRSQTSHHWEKSFRACDMAAFYYVLEIQTVLSLAASSPLHKTNVLFNRPTLRQPPPPPPPPVPASTYRLSGLAYAPALGCAGEDYTEDSVLWSHLLWLCQRVTSKIKVFLSTRNMFTYLL